MILSKYRPVDRTEVPDAPKWIEKLMDPANDQIKDLTTCLQSGFSFSDNANCEDREFDIWHDGGSTDWTEITLTKLRGKPEGVQLLWTDHDDYVQIKWKVIDIDKIGIKAKYAADPAKVTKVKIRVWGK